MKVIEEGNTAFDKYGRANTAFKYLIDKTFNEYRQMAEETTEALLKEGFTRHEVEHILKSAVDAGVTMRAMGLLFEERDGV